MKTLLTFLALAYSLTSQAAPFQVGAIARPAPARHHLLHIIDFKPGKDGLRAASVSEQALAAIPRLIATPYDNPSKAIGCSAAYVSDDGLLVTASHCVDACGENLSKCYFSLDGKRILQPFAVHTQTCSTSTVGGLEHAIACEGWRDVAILKIANPAEDFRCLPIAKEDINRTDARVVQIGFPEKTMRFNKNGEGDAPGFHEIAQVSVGKTVRSQTCHVTSIGKNFERFKDKKHLPPLVGGQQPIQPVALSQMPRMIQHTASINHGNSGGPTLNENAEIVGVLSLIGVKLGFEAAEDERAGHNEIECEGNSFSEPTQPLHEILAKVQLEARCEERRVGRK